MSEATHFDTFLTARDSLSDSDVVASAIALVTRSGQVQTATHSAPGVRITAQAPLWFRFGSLTKTLVAFAALHYAEIVGHDPTSDISDALSELIGDRFRDPITLISLLSHTAGLYNCAALQAPAPVPPNADSLRFDAAIGSFSYSNVGYALVGAWIGGRTGLEFGDWLDRHALRPLGLTGISLSPPQDATRATGHALDPLRHGLDALSFDCTDSRFAPAGFLWGTIEGLATVLGRFLNPPDAATARIMSRMTAPASPAFGPQGLAAGLGLFLRNTGTTQLAFNEGEIAGFRSRIELDFAAGTAFAQITGYSGPDNAGIGASFAHLRAGWSSHPDDPAERVLLPSGAPTYIAPGIGVFQCDDPVTLHGAHLNGVAVRLLPTGDGQWQGRTLAGRALLIHQGCGKDASALSINGHFAPATRLRARPTEFASRWFGQYHNGYWIEISEAAGAKGIVRIASNYNGLTGHALVLGPRLLATEMGLAAFGGTVTQARMHLLGTAIFRRPPPIP